MILSECEMKCINLDSSFRVAGAIEIDIYEAVTLLFAVETIDAEQSNIKIWILHFCIFQMC